MRRGEALISTLLLEAAGRAASTQHTLRGSHQAQQRSPTVQQWELIANRPYFQEWEVPHHDDVVEISLHRCKNGCEQNECGEWIMWLCPKANQHDIDCTYEYGSSNSGTYIFTLPEPLEGTGADDLYKVGFAHSNDPLSIACSDPFRILSSDREPEREAKFFSPISTVEQNWRMTLPSEGYSAVAGQSVRIQIEFDRSAVDFIQGDFMMNIYVEDGRTRCGKWLSTLDDTGMDIIGTSGSYELKIPRRIPAGFYAIGISPIDSYYAPVSCSREIEVVVDDAAAFDYLEDDDNSEVFEYFEIGDSSVTRRSPKATDDPDVFEYLKIGVDTLYFGGLEDTASTTSKRGYGNEGEVAQEATLVAKEFAKVSGALLKQA